MGLKKVISEDVALDSLELFVNKWVKKPAPKDELKESYSDVFDAICDGLLVFDEKQNPSYSLKEAIKSDTGNVVVDKLSFRTRIHPSTLADISEGLNPQKQMFKLQLRMTSYIIDQPIAMLDKLGRYDYDVVSQLAAVFF
jgi:hypothetical protein